MNFLILIFILPTVFFLLGGIVSTVVTYVAIVKKGVHYAYETILIIRWIAAIQLFTLSILMVVIVGTIFGWW